MDCRCTSDDPPSVVQVELSPVKPAAVERASRASVQWVRPRGRCRVHRAHLLSQVFCALLRTHCARQTDRHVNRSLR